MIIRAGATIELPANWADKFISDGVAELVTGSKVEEKAAAKKKGSK